VNGVSWGSLVKPLGWTTHVLFSQSVKELSFPWHMRLPLAQRPVGYVVHFLPRIKASERQAYPLSRS